MANSSLYNAFIIFITFLLTLLLHFTKDESTQIVELSAKNSFIDYGSVKANKEL